MKNDDIKIKRGSSCLSEFVKRPLPSDEEVEAFEEYAANEAKEEEIKDSLERIYQDDGGNKVDVKKLTIKKRRGWLFKLFTFLIVAFTLGGAIYGAYNYVYLKINSNLPPVDIVIESKKETAAGEEFYYYLNYKNEDKVAIKNIEIKVIYPDNFIFLESEPRASRGSDTWEVSDLASRRGDSIRIKGRLIGPADTSNIILADMTYTPENFSSEFKRSASRETKISGTGLDFSFINSQSALINEESEIIVKFKSQEVNYINNFRLTLEHPDYVTILMPEATTTVSGAAPKASAGLLIQQAGAAAWLFSNIGKNENEFKLKFKVLDKKQPKFDLKFKFDVPYQAVDEASPSLVQAPPKYYLFYEKDLTYDIIKSDLNINLIINGSTLDQGINFGQTLNYSVNYENKGDGAMKDIIIMAVLESDFLDWQTLTDNNGGRVSGDTISWSKSEIPALAELASGSAGVIDFSLKLKPPSGIDLSKIYQVKSYIKYSLEGKSASDDKQSNIITNKINSDLDLREQVRYFSDDNIAVGSGPLPPKVGQTTSLKIYWTVSNSLHDLNNLMISVSLPANVAWNEKNRSSVGSIYYDSQNNKVVWQIGRLPVSAYKADGEFNISVTPAESDRDKIMIILPGSTISALDSETNTAINKTLKAKTTKLEDDNLVETDGIVQ